MIRFDILFEKIECFFKCLWRKLACICLPCKGLVSSFISVLMLFNVNSFWIQLSYFILLSLVSFLALMISNLKKTSFKARGVDVFFTSASAVTVSSMSTLEMEVFSNAQLVILTISMFSGGEVFLSLLGLQFKKFKHFKKRERNESTVVSVKSDSSDSSTNSVSLDQIELSLVTSETPKTNQEVKSPEICSNHLKYNAITSLGYVILSYLLVVHGVGSVLIFVYMRLVPSANRVLMEKGLSIVTFSVFSTVSTFTNCGFIPTNENMVVFKKNSGLLLILIPQILLGNTLYPVCLRLAIFVLEKMTKRAEFGYMLKNSREMGYGHLLSRLHSLYLALSVLGLILVQFILFCLMEWSNSDAMGGLNLYKKVVGSLFQVVNSRHTGESVFDLSTLSSAVLVVFVVMMYLPPYTSFIPTKDLQENISRTDKKSRREREKIQAEYLVFSPLSYLAIFTALICITEREKLKEDPLNFNVLNIIIEVTSAYGNVGFSTGYSCERKIKPDGYCKNASYGFAGRWSDKGKLILICVMFFGRLKKFNLKGGKYWHLS